MGYYINPTKQSKEAWLQDNAILLQGTPPSHRQDDRVVIAYGAPSHSYAGICYCDEELQAFKHASTSHFYLAKISDLVENGWIEASKIE